MYLLDKRDSSQRNHQKVEYASAQLRCQSHLNPKKKIRLIIIIFSLMVHVHYINNINYNVAKCNLSKVKHGTCWPVASTSV